MTSAITEEIKVVGESNSLATAGFEPASTLKMFLVQLLLMIVYLWLMTHGTFQLVASEHPLNLSTAYDSLGQHLLQGSSEVDRASIGWEGLPSRGRSVMYFGPFPAVVRIILSAFAPSWSGRLARLSSFLAAAMSLFVIALLAHKELADNTACPARVKAVLFYATMLGFGVASPMFMLASLVAIYHEAIWWGLFWGLCGLYLLFRVPPANIKTRHIALLGMAAGLAMLSRITFALPLFLGLVYWSCIVLRKQPRGWSMVARGLFPLMFLVAFQLWYNYDRFGQFIVAVDWNNYVFNTPARQQGGTFNPARVLREFRDYFVPHLDNVNAKYPWVLPHRLVYKPGELFSTNDNEFLTALPLTSAWVLLTALIGSAGAIRRRDAGSVLLLLFFLIEALTVLSYYFVTQRYMLEFVPLLLAGHVLFLRGIGRIKRTQPATVALLVLLPICIYTTGITTFAWTLSQEGVPREFRVSLIRSFFAPLVPH
jgi:hypothetical protein